MSTVMPPLSLGVLSGDFSRTRIMGVVNVTPDSFYDGGRHAATGAAVAHALALAEQGADLLDVGGESTRPGSEPVPADEELRRVVPRVEGLAAQPGVPLSVDTTKASVAREALAAGARTVHEPSAVAEGTPAPPQGAARGSRPAAGSSKNRSSGSMTVARASPARFFIPPES